MKLSRWERLLAELGIVAMVGCVAAVLNLAPLAAAPLGARLAFALSGFIAAWILVRLLALVGIAAARLLGLGSIWGYVFAIPLSSALIAWVVLWNIGGAEAAFGKDFAKVWPKTVLIGAGFFLLFFLIYWRSYRAAPQRDYNSLPAISLGASKEDVAGVAVSDLHDRLPVGFPAILALTVEDHYLRVIARDRAEMLLLPLSEAIELMPEGSGQRVHRSWWVARNAIVRHRRIGRDMWFEILDGTKVPISRAMVAPLRQAGWFQLFSHAL